MTIELQKDELNDDTLRSNFDVIEESFNDGVFAGFNGKSFQFTIGRAVTEVKVPHPFTFQPTDVIITLSDSGNFITFHVDLFDEKNLVVSASGPLTIRCAIGTFGNNAVELDI